MKANQKSVVVWVDADACHVKDEIVRVCHRYGVETRFVSNKVLKGFTGRRNVTVITVPGGLDAADNYVVEHVQPGDLVLTGDIPLASRVLEAGAAALDFRGRWFTEDNIGGLVASRDLHHHLRGSGVLTDGPRSPGHAVRSRLLQELNNFLDRTKASAC